jgi:hypothetical protein
VDKFKSVRLSSEADAEAVREAMLKLLEQYEVVTVADYMNLIGLPTTFSDEKVGWTELKDIQIKPESVVLGFVIDLPDPTNI